MQRARSTKDLKGEAHLLASIGIALPRSRFTVDTDALDKQIGCVLLQYQGEGPTKSIRYWSRALFPFKCTYDTKQHECLAVVWEALLLRAYLEKTKFVARTDHLGCKWLLNLSDATGELARWMLLLSEFNLKVVHSTRIIHQAVDVLSGF